MHDTDSASLYIREVTDFYSSLAGMVPMISSEDERLIMKWRRDGISKQDVMLGIKKAFEQNSRMRRINISSCSRFVEEMSQRSRALYGSDCDAGPDNSSGQTRAHSTLVQISVNITKALNKTDDPNVKKCLNSCAKTVAASVPGPDDVYDFLKHLRKRMCEELIAGFSAEHAGEINRQAADAVLSSGRKFINSREKENAVRAHREDLILRRARIENLFSLSEADDE